MTKINELVTVTKAKTMGALRRAKERMNDKKAGATGIIVSAILLVIAVVLALTFRTSITKWLTDLSSNITTQLTTFTK